MVPGNILCFIRGEVYTVAGGMEVRGQEELPRQKGCKTPICVPEDSCESASLGIPKKTKIRYMYRVVWVNAFQPYSSLKSLEESKTPLP